VAEQLVATADCEQRTAVFDVIMKVSADLLKAGADNLLFPVRAAAQKNNICRSQRKMVLQIAFRNLCIDSTPLAAHAETLYVATVSVEVQKVGIEVYDIQLVITGQRLLSQVIQAVITGMRLLNRTIQHMITAMHFLANVITHF
jgi:hypothetical protein